MVKMNGSSRSPQISIAHRHGCMHPDTVPSYIQSRLPREHADPILLLREKLWETRDARTWRPSGISSVQTLGHLLQYNWLVTSFRLPITRLPVGVPRP